MVGYISPGFLVILFLTESDTAGFLHKKGDEQLPPHMLFDAQNNW